MPKKLLKLFIGLLLGLYANLSFAQTPAIDSLLTLLKTSKEDTVKVNTLNQLSREFRNQGEYEIAIQHANKALALSEKRSFKKGLASSYHNIGSIHYNKGDYDKALEYYFKALKIIEETGDKKGMSNSYNNIGNIHYAKGDYDKALEYYYRSLKILEETGDKKGMSTSYNNIGLIHSNNGDYDKAIEYYFKSLKIREETGDKKGMSDSYNNIGVINDEKGNYDKALEYYFKSLKIREESGDKQEMSGSYNNIGIIHFNKGNYDKALEFYFKSLKISEEIGDKNGMVSTFNNLGSINLVLKKYNEAGQWFNKGLELSKNIGSKDWTIHSYYGLFQLDSTLGKYPSAIGYYKQYVIYKDSVHNAESEKNMMKSEMKHEYEKKEAIAKAEQEKKDAIAVQEKEKQQLMLTSVIGGLILFMVFSGFIYNRFRVIRKQKHIIEIQKQEVENQRELAESRKVIAEEQRSVIQEKQKEILDSIHYAKRIQEAMLTSEFYFNEHLKADYFIYYQPKDIVSGDFYWALAHHNRFYIATADCTGHGVPGAFMSLLNISFLNENVIERNIEDPAKILNEQRKEIIKALNPTGTENSKDGMDCVLCAFDLDNKKLHFAAANNPVWVVRSEGQNLKHEIIEYKADKMPVGKYEDNAKDFTSQTIDLKKGDLVYTFTDGFADQFGGPKGKKFMYKQLSKVLLDHCHLPMKEQQKILSETINNWKGEHEQVDDILVIGVRV